MSARGHVVLVSYHALPAVTPGSLRVEWMAARLAALGWRVTLVTATRDAAPLPGVEVVTADDAPVSGARPGRVRAILNDLMVPDRFRAGSRALAARVARVLDAAPADVVLSTSPPHSSQLALARLRARRAFRWAADFRDPWTAPSRHPRTSLAAALHGRMERRVLRACDAVLANTAGNRDALLGAFPELAPGRVHVLPNAFDDAMLDAAPVAPDDPADFTYVGEVYPGMTERLVAALRVLARRAPDAVPTVAVYGDVDARERRRFDDAGLAGQLELRGRVSPAESLRAMRRAQSLLVLLPARESWTTCVPSKLYPYLAARRPVLAIVPEGDAARIVRACGAGVAVTDGDDAALADAIAAFRGRVRMGTPFPRREEGVRAFAASALAASLDALLGELAETAP